MADLTHAAQQNEAAFHFIALSDHLMEHRGYPADVVIAVANLIAAVADERQRAHEKHGTTSMEQEDLLSPWRGMILGEEALECGTALNDHRHGDIHLFADCDSVMGRTDAVFDELDNELIQTMAMAFTWWMNRRGHQLARLAPVQ